CASRTRAADRAPRCVRPRRRPGLPLRSQCGWGLWLRSTCSPDPPANVIEGAAIMLRRRLDRKDRLAMEPIAYRYPGRAGVNGGRCVAGIGLAVLAGGLLASPSKAKQPDPCPCLIRRAGGH